MRPEVESLLRAALDTREVGIVLRDVCAPYGEVVRTGVVCSKDRSPTVIVGLVEMKERIALTLARRLDAGNIGRRVVVFRYPAPAGFQVRGAIAS